MQNKRAWAQVQRTGGHAAHAVGGYRFNAGIKCRGKLGK